MTSPPRDTGRATPAGGAAALLEGLERTPELLRSVRTEIARVIVGQDRVVEEILITLLAGGHALLEGVPGLAKTLLVSTVARITSLTFQRIQFTPDLMPADITGSQVIGQDPLTGERRLIFRPGPVFAGIVLADEVNRSPPKTQAALLEAMGERQVTVGGVRHVLSPPFLVLGTQNPIEQEGTYPLPEAQRDRFLFQVLVDYPDLEEERAIVERTTGAPTGEPRAVLTGAEILRLQRVVRAMPAPEHLMRYAATIVRRTRPGTRVTAEFVDRYVGWGAGPRATQSLVLAGKARALLAGRFVPTRADVRAVAAPALRHRVIPNFRAEAEGIGPDEIVSAVVESTPVAEVRGRSRYDGRTRKLLRL